MIPDKWPAVCRWCLLVVALTAVVVAVGCEDSKEQGASTPAPTKSVTASPTPVPADLSLARSFERNGQYDEAEAAYTAVIAEGTDAGRQWARLALARIALARGDNQRAFDEIGFLDESVGVGVAEADFMLGRALTGSDDAPAAYRRYIDEGGAAVANARAELASELFNLGLVDEATAEAEAALEDLPESLRPGVVLSIARQVETIDWYQRLYDESLSSSDKALALERIGSLKRGAGVAGWQDDLQTVIARYPITAAASDALTTLLEAGEPVDAYVEAVVYYRHFQNDEAPAAFGRYLEAEPAGPHAAAAHYYIAAIDERLGDDDAALDEYATSLEIDSSGDLADDALWWSGLILEKQSRLDEASEAYGRILALSRVSEWAEDAGFRQGMIFYKQERYLDAANAWRSFGSGASDEVAAHALFWSAKAELANGDTDIAAAHLRELALGWPLDYFGLRAAALLSEIDEEATLPAFENAESDVESWLVEATGQAPASSWGILLDPRWRKAQELLTVGFSRSAAAEFRDLIWSHSGDAMALWSLAQAFQWLEQTEMASRSAQLVLEELPAKLRAEAPRGLLRLAYPQDYMGLLAAAEDSEGVSPDVMLALMRQESFFDPLAGSGAGALGLTQVIPPTAEGIAADLGIDDFQNEDLFRPVVSIEFGSYYLAEQLDAFDGNLYLALAAYNAGPGAVDRWREASGDDIDMFLEQVDIGEANLYVRLVMENLAMYRYLYGGAERPSLPE